MLTVTLTVTVMVTAAAASAAVTSATVAAGQLESLQPLEVVQLHFQC